jgi:hypothetical protein
MAAEKMHLSLSPKTAEMLRQRAREAGKPASQYVSDLVERDARYHRDQLAIAGYKALEADTAAFVRDASLTDAEGWPEWEGSSGNA